MRGEMYMKSVQRTPLTRQYDRYRHWRFLEALSDAEIRLELLELSTGAQPDKEDYDISLIYNRFRPFIKE